MTVDIVPGYERPREEGELFGEYTDMLIAGDSAFQAYLAIQHYDEELNQLEVKYGPPGGRLYLAYCDGELAGCIGMRNLDGQSCEMKRLYVRPRFRGNRIGDRLVGRIIVDAKEAGYSHIQLDTLPFLKSAIRMYRRYGFYETASYNDSPMDTSIYMRLDL